MLEVFSWWTFCDITNGFALVWFVNVPEHTIIVTSRSYCWNFNYNLFL